MVPQVHPGISLTHSEHTLNVSDGDRDASYDMGLASDVSVEVSHFIPVDLVQAWMAVSLSVNYVLAKEFLL